MLIGYARVSSTGQSLEVQHMALKAAGCEKVFKEKVSGAKSHRAELTKAIAKLKSGDVLMVTRLDRLARSTLDLLRTIDQINKVGAGFKSVTGRRLVRYYDATRQADAHSAWWVG
jgi:DNA invertase Pin-like site-specific DNA recombinase